ncbi:MAG: hydantoinase/oxoprolinase family protein [Chloroflexi bacterium]|nr:MAG: hydantoinase/oxoprolinase family protein [Chloroflexota bacterium]RLC95548.1 MAG: hydantoinase/oxoprolinase family protein [Chloroflexota bacterium]
MAEKVEERFIIALDAGGSMTDCFLVGEDGQFSTGKFLTNHEDESVSYLGSLNDAAARWGMTTAQIHQAARSSTYTGTAMVNILVTRSGSKVGLIVTRGFAQLPIIERGLTWIGQSYEDILHQQLHEHTPWMVQPENVKEVTERVSVGSYYMAHHYFPGQVVIPLVESEAVQAVRELLDSGVEVIGVLTLGSYANPQHEMRIAEIAREMVQQRGLDTPVVASYEMCAVPNETERLKTLLIQCYTAEVARRKYFRVEEAARNEGYKHELLTLLGYGAAATIRYPKLAEAAISGPVGGLLGGKFIADFLNVPNMVCWDLGCTTCDVGLIAGGLLPVRKEPEFSGHRLRMPMIAIDSIGAGCSHVVHADPVTKRITIGPESVKADLGTMYVSDQTTIGDIDLTMRYLDPDYYLGGTIKVNRDRAEAELTKRIAEPLGQDVFDVCSKILELLHARVADHINGVLLSRGLNPAEFTLLVYGAAGPLHLWGLERAIEFAEVIVVPWAAVFSSFGVAAADYFHRYDKAVTFFLTPDMTDDIKMYQGSMLSQAWQEMEERGYQELEAEGIPPDEVFFRHGISCRYIGQLSNWEVPVEVSRVSSLEDLDKVIGAFEKHYTKIYPAGARFPESGYQITEVYVEAVARKPKPVIVSYPIQGKEPPKKAYKGQRDAFFDGGWITFDLWEQDLLEAGNRIDGPAIIEHTMTTLLIPPQNYVELDEHKFMRYKRK